MGYSSSIILSNQHFIFQHSSHQLFLHFQPTAFQSFDALIVWFLLFWSLVLLEIIMRVIRDLHVFSERGRKTQAIVYLKSTLLKRKIRALMGHIFTMNFILMRFCYDIMSFNVAEIGFSRVSSFSFVVNLQLKDIMFLTWCKIFFSIDLIMSNVTIHI